MTLLQDDRLRKPIEESGEPQGSKPSGWLLPVHLDLMLLSYGPTISLPSSDGLLPPSELSAAIQTVVAEMQGG